MSDDLISRKDALDCVNMTLSDFGIDFGDELRSALEQDLENLPVAFDKEKVISEIQSEEDISEIRKMELMHLSDQQKEKHVGEYEYCRVYSLAMFRARRIVEKGKMDEIEKWLEEDE